MRNKSSINIGSEKPSHIVYPTPRGLKESTQEIESVPFRIAVLPSSSFSSLHCLKSNRETSEGKFDMCPLNSKKKKSFQSKRRWQFRERSYLGRVTTQTRLVKCSWNLDRIAKESWPKVIVSSYGKSYRNHFLFTSIIQQFDTCILCEITINHKKSICHLFLATFKSVIPHH